DALERELLRPFERGLVVGRAHHPAELEDRGRARARIGREPGLVAGDPIINVPMHGAERDRGGVAPLEGGNARRVIAAEAVAHHRDAVGIDLRAGGDVVVSGGAGDLVIVTLWMLRRRGASAWPGPSMASVLMPRLPKSRPAKITLISLALSM